jgi:hypothetical protein
VKRLARVVGALLGALGLFGMLGWEPHSAVLPADAFGPICFVLCIVLVWYGETGSSTKRDSTERRDSP